MQKRGKSGLRTAEVSDSLTAAMKNKPKGGRSKGARPKSGSADGSRSSGATEVAQVVSVRLFGGQRQKLSAIAKNRKTSRGGAVREMIDEEQLPQ